MKYGSFPCIGIRPTIDGRLGGVRESLEERTMQQARSVAELFVEHLRYPDGSPVECVIADSCIGGVREAAACADKFRSKVYQGATTFFDHEPCPSILRAWATASSIPPTM